MVGFHFFRNEAFALVKRFIPSVLRDSALTEYGGNWGAGYGSSDCGVLAGNGEGSGSVDYEDIYGFRGLGDGLGNGYQMPPTIDGLLFSEVD